MSDNSDFSGGGSGNGIGGSDETKKTHKKDKKKPKERPYAHLGEDFSSAEEDTQNNDIKSSPVKSKKPMGFMFGSAKKEKDKKRETHFSTAASESSGPVSLSGEGKKKEKYKSKLKKSKTGSKLQVEEEEVLDESASIFGVPLSVAVERNRSHDGIMLPVLVRDCIYFIENEGGILSEGIYRSSGVKSKINKLKAAYNSRQPVNLKDYDCTVVASVFKLFLRELPEPVLTLVLTPKFEAVSALSEPQKRIEGMKVLMNELPECNRLLIQWVFVHMSKVIERERFNKMTLQNVSIVLSPTMKISHRVLNCFFENAHILFDGVQIKRYIPPLNAETLNISKLPDSLSDIEEEIRKQDSLLGDLHLQISSGAASKKKEEQIWEQQRIVTQLKRKLRQKKKFQSEEEIPANNKVYEQIDYEEELNFALQTPEEPPLPPSKDPTPDLPEESEDTTDTCVPSSKPLAPQVPKQTSLKKEDDDLELNKNITIIKCDSQPPIPAPVEIFPAPKVVFKLESGPNISVITPGAGIPLLPPPPTSGKSTTRPSHNKILKPVRVAPPVKAKSMSLPREFPMKSSDMYNYFENEEKSLDMTKSMDPSEAELEELRLRFEHDELMALKSELERKKQIELKEISELKEEIASMQTLYKYRTCSVDSSENSSNAGSDKEEDDEDLKKVLADQMRENKELENTRQSLQQKIQDERAACIKLRVQIKLEQEKLKLKSKRAAHH